MPRLGALRYPKEATLWMDEFEPLDEWDMAAVAQTGTLYYFYYTQPSITVGHGAQRHFTLKGGLYRLSVLGLMNADEVMISWYIDDVLAVADQDWYNETPAYSRVQTATVTVYGDGDHTLKWVVSGQNVLSTGWHARLTKAYFQWLGEG